MRPSPYILAGFLTAFAASALAQPYQPAMTDLEIAGTDGRQDLSGFLWYPTEASGPLAFDFESEVWEGTEVVKDAAPAEDRFPLVILSHGMFGNAYNQAWLASALAERGYMVAGISHPGTSTWSRDPDQTRNLSPVVAQWPIR